MYFPSLLPIRIYDIHASGQTTYFCYCTHTYNDVFDFDRNYRFITFIVHLYCDP